MADDIRNDWLINGEVDGGGDDLQEAQRELDAWMTKVEKADDVKARLMLEKLEEDEVKAKAQQEMMTCSKNREDCQKEFTQTMKTVQGEIQRLATSRQDLLDKLKRCQAELEAKRAESAKLKQKFKIYAQIPDTEVEFKCQSEEERVDGSQPIRGQFSISQRPTVLLHGGQALVTFEEDKVAAQILKLAKCSVSCEKVSVDVKPKRITMEPSVRFEILLDVSRKELKVSNIPPSMPEERVQDRLEMSFSRPSRGGGEVDGVEYDKNTGTGRVIFLHPGVVEGLALRGSHRVDLDSEVTVQVGRVYKYQLHKFQTFCGSPKRTILLDDIEDKKDVDEDDLQDHLEIHFQKPSNYGGEIESIKFISRGTMQAFFCDDSPQSS